MSFDFREYIHENFDPKAQQMNPDQVSIHCINPDCDDNWRRKRKMTVNTSTRQAYCFKCSEKYAEIDFIAQAEGISKFQAMKIARSSAPIRTYGAHRLEDALKKITPPPPAEPDTSPVMPEKPEPCLFPPLRRILPGSAEMAYLEDRRFGQDVIDHFGLFFTQPGPPVGTLCKTCITRQRGRRCCSYANRIIIPIYREGVAVAFQGRTISGAIPKYLFPLDQPFESELYNWDHAQHFGTIIVTEGVTSAWRVWTRGYHNVTATFGKSLKTHQEKTIKGAEKVKRVIMLWDGGTLPEAYAAGMRLYPNKEVLIARLPGKLDPDECPDFPDYIESAIPIQNLNKLTVALSKLA